jgi:hypothetical protein
VLKEMLFNNHALSFLSTILTSYLFCISGSLTTEGIIYFSTMAGSVVVASTTIRGGLFSR